MTPLLHLDSGANRSAESISRRLTSMYAEIWRERHGASGYRYRDLAAAPVPPLGTGYCTLGRRVERSGSVPFEQVGTLITSPAEALEWDLTQPLISELRQAGTVLIGAPLYNYSVPAALKAWIDRVSFPGAFRDPDGGGSVLCGTRVVVISPRGGAYGPGAPREGWDFQTPWLRAYLGNLGIVEDAVRFIEVEMTLAGLAPHLDTLRPAAADSLAAARAEVRALASADDWPTGRPGGARDESLSPPRLR